MRAWAEALRTARQRLTGVEATEILGIAVLVLYGVSEDLRTLFKSLICRLEWWLAGVLGLKLANPSCEANVREGAPLVIGLILVVAYCLLSLFLFARRPGITPGADLSETDQILVPDKAKAVKR